MSKRSRQFDFSNLSPKSFLLKSKLPSLAALVLSAGASVFFPTSAQAVETIQLRYYGSNPNVPSEVTLSLDEIKQFVQSGDLSQQAREFFNINQEDPGPVQRILTKQIQIPSNFGQDFVDSSVGRFVLLQLEKLIQGSNALPDLRTAIRTSIQDDRNISLLEIIENYPATQVSLNVTGLVRTYGDVSSFVDRVLPALEVAKEYLQGIICDCEKAPATGKPQSSVGGGAVACSNSPAASSSSVSSSQAATAPAAPSSSVSGSQAATAPELNAAPATTYGALPQLSSPTP